MGETEKGFLKRWAKRKEEAREEAPAEAPLDQSLTEQTREPAEAEAKTSAEEISAEDLPDPETLGYESDFTPFLKDGVPEALKRRALRRLWRSNPVLANLDGLIDYGDDYTDAATVVANLKTLYKVGRGFSDMDLEPEPDREAGDIASSEAGEEQSEDASPETAAEARETEQEKPAEQSRSEGEEMAVSDAEESAERPAEEGAPAAPRPPKGRAAARRWAMAKLD